MFKHMHVCRPASAIGQMGEHCGRWRRVRANVTAVDSAVTVPQGEMQWQTRRHRKHAEAACTSNRHRAVQPLRLGAPLPLPQP